MCHRSSQTDSGGYLTWKYLAPSLQPVTLKSSHLENEAKHSNAQGCRRRAWSSILSWANNYFRSVTSLTPHSNLGSEDSYHHIHSSQFSDFRTHPELLVTPQESLAVHFLVLQVATPLFPPFVQTLKLSSRLNSGWVLSLTCEPLWRSNVASWLHTFASAPEGGLLWLWASGSQGQSVQAPAAAVLSFAHTVLGGTQTYTL